MVNWDDKEVLEDLYYGNEHRQGMSMDQIADSLGCARNTIAYWMNKHGIERRSTGEKPRDNGVPDDE